MGSPLGPVMACAFLCSIEEKLERENKLPEFYKRYVDDAETTNDGITRGTIGAKFNNF